MEETMTERQIGNFTLTVDHESLHKIVSDGRLLEFADTLAKQASAQISAQLVEKLAGLAVGGQKVDGGISLSAQFVFDGGDYGTRPPRPHWGVGIINEVERLGALQRVYVGGVAAVEK
jgi:hypothetical protein